MTNACHNPAHRERMDAIHAEGFSKASAVADLFKMFGDATRVRLLWSLTKGEMCVCDLAELLEMEQSAVSHQLRLLRDAHLVKTRRDGRTVVYALDDEHIGKILQTGLAHVEERQ